jgi:hypothetical protein
MHGPIIVKFPNNISKWQMGFNSAFKGLNSHNMTNKCIYDVLFAHRIISITVAFVMRVAYKIAKNPKKLLKCVSATFDGTKNVNIHCKTKWFTYAFRQFLFCILNFPINYPDDDGNSDRNVLVREQYVLNTFYICSFVGLV